MGNHIMERVLNNRSEYSSIDLGGTMTASGTNAKLLFLTVVIMCSFFSVFHMYGLGYMDKVNLLMLLGCVVGFVLAMIIIFTSAAMPILVPIYTFCEGLVLGGISATFNAAYPGIVVQAVSGTLMVLLVMGLLYKTRVIRVTEKLRSVILVSTIAIVCTYMLSMLLSLFGYKAMEYTLASSNWYGILASVIVCIVASSHLLLDFDYVEQGEQMGLPRKYEWYGAFGFVVTLVWLYVKILKLLAKVRNK